MTGSASCLRSLSVTKYNTRKPLKPAPSKTRWTFICSHEKQTNIQKKVSLLFFEGTLRNTLACRAGFSFAAEATRFEGGKGNSIHEILYYPAVGTTGAEFSHRLASCFHKDTVMTREENGTFSSGIPSLSLPFFSKPFITCRDSTLTQIFTTGPAFRCTR